MIYTTSKADATFIARLQQPVDALEQAEGSACDVRLKKSSLFHPRAALSCLQHLHVAGMPAGLSPSERLHMLGSMINMASMQQLGALGALLSILHQDGLLNGVSRLMHASSSMNLAGRTWSRAGCVPYRSCLSLHFRSIMLRLV